MRLPGVSAYIFAFYKLVSKLSYFLNSFDVVFVINFMQGVKVIRHISLGVRAFFLHNSPFLSNIEYRKWPHGVVLRGSTIQRDFVRKLIQAFRNKWVVNSAWAHESLATLGYLFIAKFCEEFCNWFWVLREYLSIPWKAIIYSLPKISLTSLLRIRALLKPDFNRVIRLLCFWSSLNGIKFVRRNRTSAVYFIHF